MSYILEFIPLRVIRYKEKSLILHGLTPQGNKAFFLPSYIKKNKNLYPYLFYPLSMLEITYYERPHFDLPFVKHIQLITYPSFALTNPSFQPLLTFLSEMYYTFIIHDDGSLYQFIRGELSELYASEFFEKEWLFKHLIKLLAHFGFGLEKWISWNNLNNTQEPFLETPMGRVNTQLLQKMKMLTFDQEKNVISTSLEAYEILQFLLQLFKQQLEIDHDFQSLKLIQLYFSFVFDETTA
jgi:hypothetical protein